MSKTPIIVLAIVILILAAAALVFSNHTNNNFTNSINGSIDNSTNSISQKQQNQSINSSISTNKSKQTNTQNKFKISAAEAKKIVQNLQKEFGETAGTPRLCKVDGDYMYIVPILKNGKKIDIIGVDPQTGDTSEI